MIFFFLCKVGSESSYFPKVLGNFIDLDCQKRRLPFELLWLLNEQ